ncbi:glycerophosphoryl diester phosphodiesterase [Kroppenstedtia guangzhouensis]|uniref:Glycerophosphoryl diester phosphodiesterase n=1 Tax=Kroppenstedtia guangzhouensis TaxID=1274356 RepID=A0ABQ1FXC4_9BACL|nr:glycerophosphodiester phosphodiesterase [Kroppenstedtia guangzhouensis]GGA32281.1 glycerophosphoryl diester phosphodiesterase [Kroppenstedtia guangzhouensis]
MEPIRIFAHRGFSAAAPENTMAAFRLAAEAGADGLELDVHLSKDREVVVIHDETVSRTTDGKGKVRELTLEELRRLDAGSRFGREFAGEKIPLLHEVLELAVQKNLWLNIELKNNKFPDPALEEKVLELTARFGLTRKVIFSSFNHYSLRRLKEKQPEVDTALLYMARLIEPWHYADRVGADSLHPYWPTVTEEVIRSCRERGLNLRPFTVNQAREMRRLIRLGVNGIITDKVSLLSELLGKTG